MLAPLPVGAVTVLACRDTLAAVVSTRLAGSFPDDPEPSEREAITVDGASLPRGVSVMSYSALPSFAVEILALDLDALHAEVMARAWRAGAWDLSLTLLTPLEGPSLGLVDAHRDWEPSALPARKQLMSAAEAGRLAVWLYKPMRGGPPVRIAAHADDDATLDGDYGRSSPPPAARRPDWSADEARQWIIRLGRSHRAAAHQSRPATPPQMRYIALLRRRLGIRGPVGPISLVAASRLIDEMLRTLRSTPGGDEEEVA